MVRSKERQAVLEVVKEEGIRLARVRLEELAGGIYEGVSIQGGEWAA